MEMMRKNSQRRRDAQAALSGSGVGQRRSEKKQAANNRLTNQTRIKQNAARPPIDQSINQASKQSINQAINRIASREDTTPQEKSARRASRNGFPTAACVSKRQGPFGEQSAARALQKAPGCRGNVDPSWHFIGM